MGLITEFIAPRKHITHITPTNIIMAISWTETLHNLRMHKRGITPAIKTPAVPPISPKYMFTP